MRKPEFLLLDKRAYMEFDLLSVIQFQLNEAKENGETCLVFADRATQNTLQGLDRFILYSL